MKIFVSGDSHATEKLRGHKQNNVYCPGLAFNYSFDNKPKSLDLEDDGFMGTVEEYISVFKNSFVFCFLKLKCLKMEVVRKDSFLNADITAVSTLTN